MTILTRNDLNVGEGAYDSIKWAIETHLKEQDTGEFHYGILHGNEDAPLRIQLWRKDPEWRDPPDRTWTPTGSERDGIPTAPAGDITGTQANDGRVVSDGDPGL